MLSSLREIITASEITLAEDPEKRFITSGVGWDSYEALLVKLAKVCIICARQCSHSDTYGYESIVTSELLPELDIELLSRCALITNSLQCLDEFDRDASKEERVDL